MMQNTISINRGSDLNFVVTWPHEISGLDAVAFEAHPLLADVITLTITDETAGTINGRIEWSDSFPSGRLMSFRVKLTDGVNDTTTPEIWVQVQ